MAWGLVELMDFPSLFSRGLQVLNSTKCIFGSRFWELDSLKHPKSLVAMHGAGLFQSCDSFFISLSDEQVVHNHLVESLQKNVLPSNTNNWMHATHLRVLYDQINCRHAWGVQNCLKIVIGSRTGKKIPLIFRQGLCTFGKCQQLQHATVQPQPDKRVQMQFCWHVGYQWYQQLRDNADSKRTQSYCCASFLKIGISRFAWASLSFFWSSSCIQQKHIENLFTGKINVLSLVRMLTAFMFKSLWLTISNQLRHFIYFIAIIQTQIDIVSSLPIAAL